MKTLHRSMYVSSQNKYLYALGNPANIKYSFGNVANFRALTLHLSLLSSHQPTGLAKPSIQAWHSEPFVKVETPLIV